MNQDCQSIYQDNVVIRLIRCSVLWAVAAMFVGVYIPAELVRPGIDFGQCWLSVG